MSYSVATILDSWRERVTGSPKQIDTDHAYVHEGYAFDAFVVSSENMVLCMRTPAATAARPWIHFRPASMSVHSGNIRFQIYDTTSSEMTHTGSTFTPVNRKYSSTITSGVAFEIGVTTCTTGTYVLKYDRVTHGGAGPGQTRIGVSKGEAIEWILKPAAEYVFYVTTTATDVGANFFWYEEDNA